MRMRLLVADDDPSIAEPLRRRFEEEGYLVDVAHDAASVLWAATENSYDVIVLDVNIRRADDGLEICRRLRHVNVSAPVLFVTGRAEVIDRVAGLRAGASDYLAKPFGFAELAERVRALGRLGSPTGTLVVGDLELDPKSPRGTSSGSADRPFATGVRAALRRSCAGPIPCSAAPNCWSTCGTSTTQAGRMSSTFTCATCATRSIVRSA